MRKNGFNFDYQYDTQFFVDYKCVLCFLIGQVKWTKRTIDADFKAPNETIIFIEG